MHILLLLLTFLIPSFALAGTASLAPIALEGYQTSGNKTADALVKTGAGYIHTITCASDAIATAGTLAIRDGVAAGGGTVIQTFEFVAAFYPPSTQILDQPFTTGLFLDFTTTADVNCSVSYR